MTEGLSVKDKTANGHGGFGVTGKKVHGNAWPQTKRQPPGRIRLLALDIDDTLTGPDGRISAANLAAVREAMARGLQVTVVTGRRYRSSAERFANDIGIRGPIGCHYGRALVTHPAGDFLRAHPLPEQVCRSVLEFAAGHRVSPSLCVDEIFFFDHTAPPDSVEGRTFPMIEVVDDLRRVVDERGDRIMSLSISGPDAAAAGELLRPETAAGSVTVYSQRITGQDQALVVVLAGQSDKGTALEDLCAMLDVDPAEAVALGDSEADIPLLRNAGYGIAMPWAEPEVQTAADCVARGNTDDAAAREIMALLNRCVSPGLGG